MPEIESHSDLIPVADHQGQTLIIRLQGEIDLNLSNELRTAVLSLMMKTKATQLLVDLRNVPYMDSSGMAILLEAMQRLRKQGGKVYLTHAQDRVKGLIDLAKLGTIFGVYDAEADALAAIAAASPPAGK